MRVSLDERCVMCDVRRKKLFLMRGGAFRLFSYAKRHLYSFVFRL